MTTSPVAATGVARAEDAFTSEGAPAPGMVQSTRQPAEDTAPVTDDGAPLTGHRTERDALGEVDVPAHVLWGAQTERALAHFPAAGERMPWPLICALALVKRTAAGVNASLGMLDAPHADAIVRAADEVLVGDHPHAFPLSVWQSGSGTQTHMNVNEVLANRASELMGGGRGDARTVHPNDHVNLGQSSNDVVATALHLAVLTACRDGLLPALCGLRDTLSAQSRAFEGIVKTGRTHLQDAVPLTLGQEVSAWAAQLDQAHASLVRQLEPVHALAIGGTAVGTGLNAHPQFGAQMAQALAESTGLPLRRADNPFAAQAAHDALVDFHGALRTLAVALVKIANDVRWLGSGPRCGLGELVLPANEPGSSVMPGKVNPSQCEALLMIAAQVMGNDVAVGIGGTSGHFQLNTAKPLLAHNLLQSIRLLTDGMGGFDRFCAQGLAPDRARIAAQLSQSLMLVTALVPHLGHDRAAALALHAQSVGCSLRDAALASGEVSAEQFDAWVVPGQMVGSIDPAPHPST